MRFRCPWSPTIPTLVCISTWGTCEKVYLFCIICSSSRLSHTFGFHLCSVPLVLLSSKRKCIPELGIGELGWPTKAIFEMCGTGQLSPLLKQQTTSACQRPDLCVCVSRRLHFSIRQEPPTPPNAQSDLNIILLLNNEMFSIVILSREKDVPDCPPELRWDASDDFEVSLELAADLHWDLRLYSVCCQNLLCSLKKTSLSWFP